MASVALVRPLHAKASKIAMKIDVGLYVSGSSGFLAAGVVWSRRVTEAAMEGGADISTGRLSVARGCRGLGRSLPRRSPARPGILIHKTKQGCLTVLIIAKPNIS